MTAAFTGVVPGPDGRPLDQIRIGGLSATGHHGVLAHERVEGQVFRADVVLHLDTRSAAVGDDLADTVSYAVVAEEVVAILEGSPVDLIETVAERVAAAALAHGPVVAVDVAIHKPQAPIDVPFDDVEVVIRRDRVKVPVVVAPTVAPQPAAEAPQHVAASPAAPAAPIPVGSVAPAVLHGEPFAPQAPAGPPPLPDVGEAHHVAQPDDQSHDEPARADQARADLHEPAVEEQEPDDQDPGEPHGQPDRHGDGAAATTPSVPARERDRMDEVPAGFVDVVIALGANLGDAQETLREAITDLDRISGIEVTDVSPLARTAAVGPEQPDFLNTVLLARTVLSARDLLHACQSVEQLHGRVRDEKWGPRTLDVDLVVYGTLTAVADDLELPHPRAHERAFVLEPWSQISPDAVLPGLGGGPVQALAATAPDRTGIRWLALDWLTEPTPGLGTGETPSVAPAAPSSPAPISGQFLAAVPPQAPVPRPEAPVTAVTGDGPGSITGPVPIVRAADAQPTEAQPVDEPNHVQPAGERSTDEHTPVGQPAGEPAPPAPRRHDEQSGHQPVPPQPQAPARPEAPAQPQPQQWVPERMPESAPLAPAPLTPAPSPAPAPMLPPAPPFEQVTQPTAPSNEPAPERPRPPFAPVHPQPDEPAGAGDPTAFVGAGSQLPPNPFAPVSRVPAIETPSGPADVGQAPRRDEQEALDEGEHPAANPFAPVRLPRREPGATTEASDPKGPITGVPPTFPVDPAGPSR
ncbi:2-amino-4-hydroxy-6-hydroxymethyldihydropteridine diphosphokinase [Oerskovia flava]|uniref:2-amino-4-hydroxy-6- hydroxymethyldihydropteridine diphosphokinase n=1 Tax=Oerskovia flava TaxID=2986422 RepID=UPI00223EFF28|nr:2-amino-4-hydroxy-6-hydroxymethyldihydropteridine diphosphokinase [Oerskovia sp. JB1-3-2]